MKHRKTILPIFAVLASALWFLFACHHASPIQSDHPQLAAGVKMQDVSFHSTALDREMQYRVFQPASLDSGEKLSVVYLLHGGGGGFRNWSNYSDVAQYARQGILFVMPEGNSSYYVNAVNVPNDRYEDYITKDLIDDVEARFPVKRDREHRAIVGVSMGGYAAIYYAFKQSELFVFAGAISPAVDVPSRRFSWKYASQWWRFRKIFGSLGSNERKALDPFQIVQTANPQVTPYIFLTAGEQEPLLGPIRRFAAQLNQRGFAHSFQTKPGGHDWGEWDEQVPGCFARLLEVVPTGAN